MVSFEVPEVDYTRYSNRQLAAVPLAVLVLALAVIGGNVATQGTPVDPGLEFSGGTELRVNAPGESTATVDDAFSTDPSAVRQVGEGSYLVTFENQSAEISRLEEEAQAAGYEVEASYTVSASFGAESQRFALVGVGIAFLGMSALVFVLFRTFVPSIAVVVSAFSDIVIPVALMNLLGIELTLGTVGALLMLIGYSVDSDILLNNHVLRRSGDFYESVRRAMRTGVTMTLTSLSAMIVMTAVATAFGIQLLAAIGTVLVFGLAADLMNTYMLNLSLLRWYKYEGVAR